MEDSNSTAENIAQEVHRWLQTKAFNEINRSIIDAPNSDPTRIINASNADHAHLPSPHAESRVENARVDKDGPLTEDHCIVKEEKSTNEQCSFLQGFALASKDTVSNQAQGAKVEENVEQIRKSRRKSKPRRIFYDEISDMDCTYCGKEFTSKTALNVHEEKCAISYEAGNVSSDTELEEVDEMMKSENSVDAEAFNESDDSEDVPLGNLKSSQKEMFMCIHCQQTFDHHKKFSRHVRDAHDDKKAFVCDICGNSYVLYESLRRHMRVHNEQNQLACEECGKKFTEKLTLQRHMTIHTGEKPFKCPECNMAFRDPSTMRKHIKRHNPDRPYKCETCGKGFASSYDVKKHARIHMNNEERPYKCEFCNKAFYLIAAMKTHVRIHLNDRPFKCDICGFAFTDVRNLYTHKKIHTKTRDHQCDICGSMFKWNTNLVRHVQIVHEKQKLFACSICGKRFGAKGAMKIHEVTHSTERPCKCEECGKDFSCKTALKSHMRVHSLVKKFVCELCNKGFNRGFQLKRHLLRCGKVTTKGSRKTGSVKQTNLNNDLSGIPKEHLEQAIDYSKREILVKDIDYSKLLNSIVPMVEDEESKLSEDDWEKAVDSDAMDNEDNIDQVLDTSHSMGDNSLSALDDHQGVNNSLSTVDDHQESLLINGVFQTSGDKTPITETATNLMM